LGNEKHICGCERSAAPSAVVPQRGAPIMKKISTPPRASRLQTVLISSILFVHRPPHHSNLPAMAKRQADLDPKAARPGVPA